MAIATRHKVMMDTRARMAPCTHRDRNTLPSPVVDRCFRPRRVPHVEEFVEREVVDLKLERRVIRTVWDSSSSIRWPRLSVT